MLGQRSMLLGISVTALCEGRPYLGAIDSPTVPFPLRLSGFAHAVFDFDDTP